MANIRNIQFPLLQPILKLNIRRKSKGLFSPKDIFLQRPHLQTGEVFGGEGVEGIRYLGNRCISQQKYLVPSLLPIHFISNQ